MKGLELTVLLCILLGTFRVCRGLTCTPKTENTCVKSVLVTGNCVQSVCECVSGAVPNYFGCHYPFKPTINVRYPFGWSGELHTDGHLFMECLPANLGDENYKWYKNGTLLDEKSNDLLVKHPVGVYEFECVANAYGTETEKSDSIIITVEDRFEKFTKKPVVAGMPTLVSLNATIHLACENVPATYNWYKWHIYNDGQKESLQPDSLSRTVSIVMTADRFNSTVTCTMDHMIPILNIDSDPEATPLAPAEDIPGVIVKGENTYTTTGTLSLACEISGNFIKSSNDVITYTWRGPDGDIISGETSRKYQKSQLTTGDSGMYRCTVSFNGKPPKTSPNFDVTILPADITSYPMIKTVPLHAVVGGHVALICSVNGHDPSTSNFTWQYLSFTSHGVYTIPMPNYSDNVIQVNDIKTNDFRGVFYMCMADNAYGTGNGIVLPTINYTENVKPIIKELNDSTIDTYVLSCNTRYETPGTMFEWHIDDVKQAEQTQKVIRVDTRITSHQVKCYTSFNGATSASSDPFDIPASGAIAPPVVEVEGGQPQLYIVGMFYVLICSSLSHNESATYSWMKGSTDLAVSTRTLTLNNIQTVNNGSYHCNITFGSDSEQSKTALEIVVTTSIDAPVVEAVGSPSVFLAGHSYTLTCSSQTPISGMTYKWKKGQTDLGVNSMNFVFTDVQSINNGNYTCVITAGDVTAEAENPFHLIVEDITPPVIEAMEHPKAFIVGGTYSLLCSSPSHQQDATYSWMKGGNPFRGLDQILTLSNITKADSGNYSCSITIDDESQEAQQIIQVVVTSQGKYCTSDSDCKGEGFANVCSGLQCTCLPKFNANGNKCVASGANTNFAGIFVFITVTTALIRLL